MTLQKAEKKSVFKRILETREISLLFVLAIMFILLSVSTDVFLTKDNISNVFKQVAITCVLACGLTFIISGGGIDLSMADNMALSSVMTAMVLAATGSDVLAILTGVLLGGFIGTLNGTLITTLKLPPFIITMGVSNICKGVGQLVTKGYPTPITNDSAIYYLGQRNVFGELPVLIICIPVAVLIGMFVLNKTVLGNRLQAVGGNSAAAQLSGLNVKKLRIITYMIGGIFAGVASIMTTGRLNGGNPNAAGTLGMDAIAATVVGGTSMAGGSGTVIGSMLGAIMMQLIKNGLVLLQVNMYFQNAVIGIVLICVCALDSLTQQKKS